VIIAIEGSLVKGFDDLVTALVRTTKVGQTVALTVLRQGKEEPVIVTLAARPKPHMHVGQAENNVTSRTWLGIAGLTITPEVARGLHLPADQHGVLVERIERGSPADRAGLRGRYKRVHLDGRRLLVGGDISVAWDDQPVAQIEDLQTLLQMAQPSQQVTLTVLRDGQQIQVAVDLSRRPATGS
jgi:S1-C subfamily serine protease